MGINPQEVEGVLFLGRVSYIPLQDAQPMYRYC